MKPTNAGIMPKTEGPGPDHPLLWQPSWKLGDITPVNAETLEDL
jgi:hypothetical protein